MRARADPHRDGCRAGLPTMWRVHSDTTRAFVRPEATQGAITWGRVWPSGARRISITTGWSVAGKSVPQPTLRLRADAACADSATADGRRWFGSRRRARGESWFRLMITNQTWVLSVAKRCVVQHAVPRFNELNCVAIWRAVLQRFRRVVQRIVPRCRVFRYVVQRRFGWMLTNPFDVYLAMAMELYGEWYPPQLDTRIGSTKVEISTLPSAAEEHASTDERAAARTRKHRTRTRVCARTRASTRAHASTARARKHRAHASTARTCARA